MEVSSVQQLYTRLMLLVLSVIVSDTGVGSCLEEFQCLKYAVDPASAEKWDGVLSLTTTNITDDEINQYHLNLKENVPTRRLTKLPSSSKNDCHFEDSRIEVFGQYQGPSDISWVMAVEFLPGLIGLADKSSDIKWKYHFESHSQTFLCIPSAKLGTQVSLPNNLTAPELGKNVVIELAVECDDIPGSRCEKIVPANECSVLSSAASNIERLKSGLKEYVFKHGNSSSDICHSCFSDGYSEQALVYIAHPNDMMWKYLRLAIDLKHKNQYDKTIVLYFKDFSPCSISQSALNGLTSIDWKNYGLSLRSIADQDGYIFLEWENLPANTHIDLAHMFCPDSQICSYAPDLARTIAALVLSSNDSLFQGECLSLLGLQPQEIGGRIVEDCIKEKIISAIEINDRKPQTKREAAPFLFEDDFNLEPYVDNDEYEGEEVFSVLDL
ncbi:hypothetical protein C3L33_13481, partial [Rhododendron williamsianum]